MDKRRKTHEQFVKEVYELEGDKYTVVGKYIKAKEKLEMLHNECGKTFLMKPINFTGANKHRCPHCFGKKLKTTEQFKKEVFDLEGDEYTVLGEYVKNNVHIEIKHNKCNKTFFTTPNCFVTGSRCHHCFQMKKLTHEEHVNRMKDLVGDEYTTLGKYTGTGKHVKIRHNLCGYEWEQKPYLFYRGQRCPQCAGQLVDDELFKERINELVGDEYTFLDKYTTSNTMMRVRHNSDKCNNHTYKISPNGFTAGGSRCPVCCLPKGEKAISRWLDRNKIEYQRQYKFDDCRYINPLHFDFAVFNDGELQALIEYDGKQHFKPIEMFGGEEFFNNTQLRDKTKNDYCKKNNINLIRIPYWDFNKLDTILSQLFLAQAKSHS